MSDRAKAYLIIVVVIAVGFGGFRLWETYSPQALAIAEAKSKKAAEDADTAIPVSIQAAARGSISDLLVSTANLRAMREVDIASQADGVVLAVAVEEGDYVETGKLLASLDGRELEINLALAEQRLAQTKVQRESAEIRREKADTQIKNKRDDLKRNEEALAEGLVSDTEVAAMRHQLDELQHDLRIEATTVREQSHRIEELESEINKANLMISRTRIVAPFSGRLTERTVDLGQTVRNSDKLFKLGAFTPLFADVHLAEQDSPRVRPDQKAVIRLGATGADEIEGRVVRVSPVVDDSTGTVKVTTELRPTSTAFRPGAFVRVEIQTDTRDDVVLIPKQAVIEEDGGTFVFVEVNSVAERREVELGYQDDTSYEVLSGVNAGDRVITAGQGKLKDGDKTRAIGG
jgi:membrane fusion protein (multidrug efflux system)